MGSEYLTSLKNAKFDELEGRLQGTQMIYKGIKRICRDPTPLRKNVEDYRSAISAFSSLKKVASSCHYSDDVAKEKALCTEQINLVRSRLAMIRTDLGASMEKLKGVEQKIVDLQEALRLAREEER